ncbi:polyprenyl synthetase family protein [Dongia sp.]|uniref:polyprenyl synthetase family protein n=1 Tax=Dongia sp. TaxID=1977262 RepID=UPI0035B4DB46
MHPEVTVSIETALNDAAISVNRKLNELIKPVDGAEARVIEAMRYATMVGGKRIRPYLLMNSAAIFDVHFDYALRAAAAIEMLHCYSLVHDDLPAMDNSDLRRGKPTCHKQFDEATAILAGDGLLTMAFEVLSHPDTHPDGDVRAQLCHALAVSGGANGMVGGQMIDLWAENQELDIGAITRLQRMKTGDIIAFSCEAGAILGHASKEQRHALVGYAHDLGLAFQIVDDLLDAEGDAAQTGKPTGADAAAGKATFVSILGLERARQQARLLGDQANAHLDGFGRKADPLRWMTDFVINRKS